MIQGEVNIVEDVRVSSMVACLKGRDKKQPLVYMEFLRWTEGTE